MEPGVRIADPARFDLRGEPSLRRRTLRSTSTASSTARCQLGDDVEDRRGTGVILRCGDRRPARRIRPFTHIDGGNERVHDRGRCVRRRPLRVCASGADARRGRARRQLLVEVKNSQRWAAALRPILAYLGDATVGERVNFGAGSITANYDGALLPPHD